MINELLIQKFSNILDEDIINQINKVGIIKQYIKNDIIIDINQPMDYIPLLLSGNVKILREDNQGYDLLIYFLEAGDTCTMSLSCIMGGSKSKIRAVAEKDSTLILIPVKNIQQWFHENHSWRNFILESYQTRFNEMLETIDKIAFMKMDERLLKYLINKKELYNSNHINIKHQDISEDLHTSRVVISRLLKQLEKEGKIKLSRNKIEML